MAHTNTINVAWNCKRTLCIEVVYINCLVGSLNIYISKTLVPDSGALFAYLSINKRPYYNSGLFLNESIDLISSGL